MEKPIPQTSILTPFETKFSADTARCHHTNAGLKSVLVEQINNTQLRECRKTNEHALHIDAKMACFGWAQDEGLFI